MRGEDEEKMRAATGSEEVFRAEVAQQLQHDFVGARREKRSQALSPVAPILALIIQEE